MKIKFRKVLLQIDVSFAAVITLTLLLDESGVCALALFCGIVHEAGHIICLAAIGERPKALRASFYGVRLERGFSRNLTRLKEIAIYASGPAANAVLAAFLFPFGGAAKTAAIVSLCVGAFNLAPCRPLDGGNVLFFALRGVTSEEKAEKICFWISALSLAPLASAGLALASAKGNASLLAVAFYLFLATVAEKNGESGVKI